MIRIFTSLAVVTMVSIIATIGVGFWSFSLPRPSEFWKDINILHFFLGLTTAIFILLVHCLIFIYFLGTGRWVKEVTLAYKMPDEPHHKLTRELKRKTFPPALFAMLIGIATSAAGTGVQLAGWHWTVHLTGALLTLLINAWAFRVEYRNVTRNARIIEEVLDDVDRIRAAHGLASNAEALLEEERQVAALKRPG